LQINFLLGAKMKNVVKLFTLALVFGFLVGCGSGGGSSDSEDDGDDKDGISLSLVKSYFPAFPDSTYTLRSVETNKEYVVSSAQVDSFNASVIQAQSYVDEYDNKYSKNGVLPNINAYVFLDSGDIDLYLDTYLEFDKVMEDDTYKDAFGDIDGDVVYAYIYKDYNEDISSKYAAYALTLGNTTNKFNCSKLSGGNWQCNKKVGNLRYVWEVEDNYSFFYDIIAE
jgi:hypothetical protein